MHQISWTLVGPAGSYVVDGHAHDLRRFDFTNIGSIGDECESPGGGALFLKEGAQADINGCLFDGVRALNGNGGGVVVASDFALNLNGSTGTSATFTRCQFKDFHSDFYGGLAFSSVAQINFIDSHLGDDVESSLDALETGTVFNFGGSSNCLSGCPAGTYGVCSPIDDCVSCQIGVCQPCPAGTFSEVEGTVSVEQCRSW